MFNFKSDIFGNDIEYVDPCICNAWVATAIIGSAVIGGAVSAYSANKAANAQTQAAAQAAQTQYSMYNTTRGDLEPYRDIGKTASTELTTRLKDLTSPISVNPDDFTNSEQYKFLERQGQRGVTNSAAARGLASSGAALKGAIAFNTGLNSTQWQQNFNNQVTNQTNAYNRLKGLVDTGENASAQTGTAGQNTANQVSGAQIGAGNAQAAGANATGAAVTNVANNVGSYVAYKGLYGGSGNVPSAQQAYWNAGNVGPI